MGFTSSEQSARGIAARVLVKKTSRGIAALINAPLRLSARAQFQLASERLREISAMRDLSPKLPGAIKRAIHENRCQDYRRESLAAFRDSISRKTEP